MISDTLKTVYHIVLSPVRGKTHEERLQSFYKGQADNYDAFRRRMLHGRKELIDSLPAEKGHIWVDIGAGTGENAEMMGERLSHFRAVHLVDLCEPLLEVAKARIERNGWKNVRTVHADATEYRPEEQADLVTFSYSLTMIPDWFAALENAYAMLKPGGRIGVVDFYVSRTYPEKPFVKHSWATRTFWPAWFASDNVWLNRDHLPYLRRRFKTLRVDEGTGKLPLMPFVRVPHYRFIGTKPIAPNPTDPTPTDPRPPARETGRSNAQSG
jgi:S-adenosylmethionine-diacylgycerolhomoserine-N-methlytransferase